MNPDCPACIQYRPHSDAERTTFHPLAGHGFSEGKWSHPEAKRLHDEEQAEIKAKAVRP